MTIFDAVNIFLELFFPVELTGFYAPWYDTFRLISILVITSFILINTFILPIYRFVKYGMFGGSAKNKNKF